MGDCLRTDSATPIGAWAEVVGSPYFWQAWGHLLHSVQTGENAFQDLNGKDVWQFRAEHPEHGATFDRAMTQFSRGSAEAVIRAYDFSPFRHIVDVGGGQGLMLAAILRAHPHVRGTLFDQPDVVAGAKAVLAERGVIVRKTWVVESIERVRQRELARRDRPSPILLLTNSTSYAQVGNGSRSSRQLDVVEVQVGDLERTASGARRPGRTAPSVNQVELDWRAGRSLETSSGATRNDSHSAPSTSIFITIRFERRHSSPNWFMIVSNGRPSLGARSCRRRTRREKRCRRSDRPAGSVSKQSYWCSAYFESGGNVAAPLVVAGDPVRVAGLNIRQAGCAHIR